MKSKWKKAIEAFMFVLLVLTVMVYILYITNEVFGYIPLGSLVLDLLAYFIYYGPLVLAMSMSLYMTDGKRIVDKIVCAVFWLLLIIFAISPTLWGLLG